MKKIALLLLFLSTVGSVAFAQDDANQTGIEEVEDESEVSGDDELQKRDETTLPNIGYLFRGYNILKGNPLSPERSFDPGFRQMIFNPTYKKERQTADRRYKIPDYVDITRKQACRSEFSSDTVMTMSDYQKSLLAKASVEGSGSYKIVEASFSASTEYSRVQKTVESNTKSIIKSEAYCTVYEGMLHTGKPPELSENFIGYVTDLLASKDYGNFLDTFGTHFIEAVDMGARFTKLQEISKESQEKMQKEGIDVKLAASLSAAGIGSVSTEYQHKTDEESQNKFERAVENTVYSTVGSKPPSDGKDSTWMNSAIKEPLPVFYRLRSILEIFKPQYFTGINVDYNAIKRKLSKYLTGYCRTLKAGRFPDADCEGPPKGCKGGSQCSVNAKCIDTPTTYKCECKTGFEGNGKMCDRDLKWKMTSTIVHSSTRGPFGKWGGAEYCEGGIFAKGFTFRVEKDIGSGDDTGGNAVCLRCGDVDVCSKEGYWGTWSDPQICPRNSFLSGWRQNVEKLQWLGDDTALDNVEYRCRDIETWQHTKDMKVDASEWGTWSRWKECPRGEFICGIETKVEDPGGDDTALNDIIHQCCKPIHKKKKKKATKAKQFLKEALKTA